MAGHNAPLITLFYRKLRDHLHLPLFRNGYTLTLSSFSTSAIGLAYWILAAHSYPAEIVGINTALISAMMFLAGVSVLNMMSALIRFIPATGRSTMRFVASTYLVSLVVSAITSTILITFLPKLSPVFQLMAADPNLAVWFILSTMAWCIFVLQDSVLTGLRMATWVPVENTVFSLIKIVLMLVFINAIPQLGIFASVSLGLVITILPTNLFIFKFLIPRYEQEKNQATSQVKPGQVVRFIGADCLGSLFWLACTFLMPVIVVTVAGARANAVFYLSWTIAYSLYLISPNMGSSLVVESARDPANLASFSKKVLINTLKMVIPAAGILAIGAPYILKVFGESQSSEGGLLLALLALSAIPHTVNSVFISVSRVQRRMRAVMLTLGLLSTMVLGFGFVFLKTIGIEGIGVAWLFAQTLIAAVVWPTQLQKLWAQVISPGVIQNLNNLLDGRTRFFRTLFRIARFTGVLPLWQALKSLLLSRNKHNQVIRLLKSLRDGLLNADPDFPENLQVSSIASTVTGRNVAFLGPPGYDPAMVLKSASNLLDGMSLRKQFANLFALQQMTSLGEWRNLLPGIISTGVHDGEAYLIERNLPGIAAIRLMNQVDARQQISEMAITAIDWLHRQTAQLQAVDDRTVYHWVHQPLSRVHSLLKDELEPDLICRAIDQLEAELQAALEGKLVSTSWTHGDYSPSNVLVHPFGGKITGIVDWDLAGPGSLSQLDIMHWVVSTRMAIQRREMGEIVCQVLQKEDWTPAERYLFDAALINLPGSPIDLRTVLLITWINHIQANLTKTIQYRHRPVWVSENILPILQVIG